MKLTTQQIKDLAEVERLMDSGELPFVIYGGHRASMDAETLRHFGLQQGQTITDPIWEAILEFKIARCQEEIAMRKHPN